MMRFTLYQDDLGEWRWRLRARNGQIVADCGEGYKTRAACLKGVSLVQSSGKAKVKLSE
jgi:uncharacterized protein YegP (UPF0339 family)